jgi:hypothetical protein
MQWTRVAVSDRLPMSFFDNPEVRKTVLMTSECGQNYIIPKLDKLIDEKNMGKMREMTRDLTTAVFNDGWFIDALILQVLVCPYVVSPQGRTVDLFCIGMRT